MIYVVDTCTIRELLFHFDRTIPIFEAMWLKLESMIKKGEVIFVKESYKELENQVSKNSEQIKWLKKYKSYFFPPSNEECSLVVDIYSKRNFQNNIAQKNMLEGRPVADAFIVAKAKVNGATVVSREKYSENAAKIPNICREIEVECLYDSDFQRMLFS